MDYLACTSWDKQTRVWQISSNGQSIPKTAYSHDSPILTCAWMKDGSKLFSGGDKSGKLLDIATGQNINFASHDAPIKCSTFCESVSNMSNILITGGWDKALKYWDYRSPAPVSTLSLPERCYAMDCTGPLLVVATAERHILIYNLSNPTVPYKTMTSPLKFQTRCIANFNTKNGFAIGSIEGRVGIQYIEEKDSSGTFSFKCHRDGNNVFSINSISFHPLYGTFSTAGSDGTFNFWDKDTKQRLKTWANVGPSISCTAFSRDGNIFAYASSYDWSKGHEGRKPEFKDRILLHAPQDDIKPKKKK